MEKQLMAEERPEMRKRTLQDSCYKVYEGLSYIKPLTEEELQEKKQKLFEAVQKAMELQAELKEFSAEIKSQIKGLDLEKERLVSDLTFKQESKFGTLYGFDDQQAGLMFLYDEFGTQVDARPLKPEERQSSILTAKWSGTNGIQE